MKEFSDSLWFYKPRQPQNVPRYILSGINSDCATMIPCNTDKDGCQKWLGPLLKRPRDCFAQIWIIWIKVEVLQFSWFRTRTNSTQGSARGPGPCPGKFSVPGTESRNSLVPGPVPKSWVPESLVPQIWVPVPGPGFFMRPVPDADPWSDSQFLKYGHLIKLKIFRLLWIKITLDATSSKSDKFHIWIMRE